MPVDMHWQVQEAKQRFSELLRKVEAEGPQYVSRHGRDVAVIITSAEYERLRRKPIDLNDVLLRGPTFDFTDEFDRQPDLMRNVDLSDA